MTAQLKFSVAQQIEQIDLELATYAKQKPLHRSSQYEFYIARLQAVRRSLMFIEAHKQTFLDLVAKEGMPGGLRNVDD